MTLQNEVGNAVQRMFDAYNTKKLPSSQELEEAEEILQQIETGPRRAPIPRGLRALSQK